MTFSSSATVNTPGAKRNIWRYAEDLSYTGYSASNSATKDSADFILYQEIKLSKIALPSYYSSISSNLSGLNLLNLFQIGQKYLFSFYAKGTNTEEQYVWPRIVTGATFGHAPFLFTSEVRRISYLFGITNSRNLDLMNTPTIALGAGTGVGSIVWGQKSNSTATATTAYVGGFQIEQVNPNTKNGIASIGDSIMARSSSKRDAVNGDGLPSAWTQTTSGLLNAPWFNRAVGGEQTPAMDARWATDISPLAVNAKYVFIAGGMNDLGNARTASQIIATLQSMANKAASDGMIPVIATITPRSTGTAVEKQVRRETNSLIKSTFANVIDVGKALEDPSDPDSLPSDPSWYGDGIHLGPSAYKFMSQIVADWPGWNLIRPSSYQSVPTTTPILSNGNFSY